MLITLVIIILIAISISSLLLILLMTIPIKEEIKPDIMSNLKKTSENKFLTQPMLNKKSVTPLKNCRELIREVNSKNVDELDEEYLIKVVDELTYSLFTFPVTLSKGYQIYRCRPCDKQYQYFKNTSELVHRKTIGNSTQGRVNSIDQALFYGSTSLETTVEEKNLSDFEFMNIIRCEVKDDKKCIFVTIGDIDNVRRHGKTLLNRDDFKKAIEAQLELHDSDISSAVRIVDAFLSDRFSRVGENEYKVTNIIANEFLRDQKIDGIIYPSVTLPGNLNFAIKPTSFEESFQIIDVEAHLILRNHGYGVMHAMKYGASSNIDENGKIHWDKYKVPDNIEEIIDSM